MMGLGATYRRIPIVAVCALTLNCALVAAARPPRDASETASGKSGSTHSAVPKKTTASSKMRHLSASPSTGVKKSSASGKKPSAKSTGKRSSRRKPPRVVGQQKIDSERATAIQQALIREHYLTGEPAGTWDEVSEEAMRRYQTDHGWQNKTVPDSRALISLGLGPSKDHLLNPESAMTTAADARNSPNGRTTAPSSPATGAPVMPAGAVPAAPATPSANDTASPQ